MQRTGRSGVPFVSVFWAHALLLYLNVPEDEKDPLTSKIGDNAFDIISACAGSDVVTDRFWSSAFLGVRHTSTWAPQALS